MMFKVIINMPIENHEVPALRELIGWGRRDKDYPALFERSNFWAGVRDEDGQLIEFGSVTEMGLEHGYMEDIMVHPDYQKRRIGVDLVKGLLRKAEQFGLGIVTVTYKSHNVNFYQTCGFTPGLGGVWKK